MGTRAGKLYTAKQCHLVALERMLSVCRVNGGDLDYPYFQAPKT